MSLSCFAKIKQVSNFALVHFNRWEFVLQAGTNLTVHTELDALYFQFKTEKVNADWSKISLRLAWCQFSVWPSSKIFVTIAFGTGHYFYLKILNDELGLKWKPIPSLIIAICSWIETVSCRTWNSIWWLCHNIFDPNVHIFCAVFTSTAHGDHLVKDWCGPYPKTPNGL